MSFETDEDALATFMSQFGDVVYSRTVVDPVTDHSKGIIFCVWHELHAFTIKLIVLDFFCIW